MTLWFGTPLQQFDVLGVYTSAYKPGDTGCLNGRETYCSPPTSTGTLSEDVPEGFFIGCVVLGRVCV